MPMIQIEGEWLKEASLRITDEQLVLSEPKTIKVLLWRSDEARDREKPFEIQLGMPRGDLYIIARYETQTEAEQGYSKIEEGIGNGSAKIELGRDFRVVNAAGQDLV
jgi:hypothetical protein